MKNKVYVVGNPIKHSKSPLIHNYWIKKYSIDAIYQKLKIDEEEIKNLIDNLRKSKILGFNVTIPFKKKLLEYVDILDPSAYKSKAINTVYKSGRKIIGCNTDGTGFINSLEKDLKYSIPDQCNIFLIGSGGAAFGIISSLIELNPKTIEIVNRTESSALTLINHFKKISPKIKFKLRSWGSLPHKNVDIVINSTSCGMKQNDKVFTKLETLPNKTFVYDIIYNPAKTSLIMQAEELKLRHSNGVYMLIRQAAESFEKWFNVSLTDSDIKEVIDLIGNKL